MANTKKLSRPERKKAKRTARKELSKLNESMNPKERNEFRKAEKGLKAFVTELRAKPEPEPPKEAPKAAPAAAVAAPAAAVAAPAEAPVAEVPVAEAPVAEAPTEAPKEGE